MSGADYKLFSKEQCCTANLGNHKLKSLDLVDELPKFVKSGDRRVLDFIIRKAHVWTGEFMWQPKNMAKPIGMSPGNVYKALARLEKHGLIIQSYDHRYFVGVTFMVRMPFAEFMANREEQDKRFRLFNDSDLNRDLFLQLVAAYGFHDVWEFMEEKYGLESTMRTTLKEIVQRDIHKHAIPAIAIRDCNS